MGPETTKETTISEVVKIQCHRQTISNHRHQSIHRRRREQPKKQFLNVFDHSARWVNSPPKTQAQLSLFKPFLLKKGKGHRSHILPIFVAADIPYNRTPSTKRFPNTGFFACSFRISVSPWCHTHFQLLFLYNRFYLLSYLYSFH